MEILDLEFQTLMIENIEIDEDGNKYAKMGNITWFTNL